jgi:hypothetical protein
MDKRELIRKYGTLYSEELGIKLKSKDRNEIFKWFLASVLFGAPISESAAKKTYILLNKNRVNTPEGILKKGWNGLVRILDNGGYTRYDFKTADKLLEMSKNMRANYRSDLNYLYHRASSQDELERMLKLAKGIGNTTISIFLRDMANIWKVVPKHSDLAIATAKKLGIHFGKKFDKRLDTALVRYAHTSTIPKWMPVIIH